MKTLHWRGLVTTNPNTGMTGHTGGLRHWTISPPMGPFSYFLGTLRSFLSVGLPWWFVQSPVGPCWFHFEHCKNNWTWQQELFLWSLTKQGGHMGCLWRWFNTSFILSHLGKSCKFQCYKSRNFGTWHRHCLKRFCIFICNMKLIPERILGSGV